MIIDFIVAVIMIIATFYIWNSISIDEVKWKEIRTWGFIFITTSFTILNYFVNNGLFKFLNITFFLILVYKLLFKKNLKDSIIIPVISQILYCISESFFTFFALIILKGDINFYINNLFGSILSNIAISFLAIILSKNKFIKNLTLKISRLIAKQDEKIIIFCSSLVIYSYSIVAFNTYYRTKPEIMIILSISVTLLSLIIIYMFFKAKDDYYEINDKYNNSLQSLKELENALTNHRIDNHENKNQLMTIRNMTTSKKIIQFIDTILENNLKDDKNVMHETSSIPSGGLRGLVYSKLLLMKNKNIDYELDVSSSVRIIDVLNYGNETITDVCKIVGIFLDNAIEEVDNLEDKYIIIEMYTENDIFNILITNIFDSSIKKDNIYNAGVSTKGGNHGYGLSLVNKIIKRNCKLSTHHEINGDEFTQVLNIRK